MRGSIDFCCVCYGCGLDVAVKATCNKIVILASRATLFPVQPSPPACGGNCPVVKKVRSDAPKDCQGWLGPAPYPSSDIEKLWTRSLLICRSYGKSDVAMAIAIRLSTCKQALTACERSQASRSSVQSPVCVPANVEKNAEPISDVATSLTQKLLIGCVISQ